MKRDDNSILVRVAINGEASRDVKDFYTLCALRGITKEQGLSAIISQEVAKARAARELEGNWLDWDGLARLMREHGFIVNRTTFWKYRMTGDIAPHFVRTNGNQTVYNADGILPLFTGGAIKV
jgi:hypothetical protein